MSHIRDTWVTKDGRQTPRFGHGKRWRARWTGPDGIEHGKCFARKADAEQFLAMEEKSRVRADCWPLMATASTPSVSTSTCSGKFATTPRLSMSAAQATSSPIR
jgi:hypothetical protein